MKGERKKCFNNKKMTAQQLLMVEVFKVSVLTLSAESMSAPCSSRHSTMSLKPRAEAVSNGLSPSRFRALTSQPASHRALATAE